MIRPRITSRTGPLLRLWPHLSRRRRRQFLLLCGLMLVSAVAEIVNLGAVLPFLGALTAPQRVFAAPVVGPLVRALDITSTDTLILLLTVVFGSAVLIAGLVRMLLLWASTRLAFAAGADISIEVYRRTLYQPYRVHVDRNSSEVISGIAHKVGAVVEVLNQALTLTTSVVLTFAIVVMLLVLDPAVALLAMASFGLGYVIIAALFRKRLHANSRRIADEQTRVIKALQEGLGGIREVLLDGTQTFYCTIYSQADLPLRRAQGNNLFIAASPRFVMETLGMLVVAALAYGLSRRSGGLTAALPLLGALALGAQRLLPTLQQGYTAWATIAGRRTSVADTIDLLQQPMSADVQRASVPLPLRESIRFDSVCFRYAREGPWVLDHVELTIPRGSRVGFVGSTGTGKSTLLDLLMGLLEPDDGQILIDGQQITRDRLLAWQRAIAHVPQTIFLCDASLAENIAFGVPAQQIDLHKVRRAAAQAQIAGFIESQPAGYDTVVGERGVRLSGGQRQRIGIARALYKEANVLVFDEATSALDTATERSVMEAIESLDRELTILLIAHRLSTVRRCDTIVELQQGRIVAQGTFQQLLERSPSFQRLADATP